MSLREARLGYREHVVSVPHLYAAARKFALQRASRVPGLGPRLVEVALKRRYGSHVITPLKVRNFIQAHHDEESKAVSRHCRSFQTRVRTGEVNFNWTFLSSMGSLNQVTRFKST